MYCTGFCILLYDDGCVSVCIRSGLVYRQKHSVDEMLIGMVCESHKARRNLDVNREEDVDNESSTNLFLRSVIRLFEVSITLYFM